MSIRQNLRWRMCADGTMKKWVREGLPPLQALAEQEKWRLKGWQCLKLVTHLVWRAST